MRNSAQRKELEDIESGLGFSESTPLEDISQKLDNIENELLLLNEKAEEGKHLKNIERLLFFILIVLIIIFFKLS